VRAIPITALLITAIAAAAEGQAPLPTAPHSLGQPPRHQLYAAGSGAFEKGATTAGILTVGFQRPLMNPVLGLAAVAGELYGASGGNFPGAGARALLRSPVLAIGAGADLSFGQGGGSRVDPILTYQSALRRGGLVGAGTMLRVDWLPTRGGSVAAGIHVPLNQPLAGRTRPRSTAVRLPGGSISPRVRLDPRVESALRDVAASASVLRVTTSLYSPGDVELLKSTAAATSGLSTHEDAAHVYHARLAAAFAAASGADSARAEAIAVRARDGLFDHVIVPYDTLFGRPKQGNSIRGLSARAHASFSDWVRDSSATEAATRPALLAVHARWLSIIESIHRDLVDRAGDSRMVWLPVRLALQPDRLDDQAEIDSILGRLAGRPFTDDNALTYLRSADLPLEIARTIFAARDYHLLWLHDFVGVRDETKELDNVSYEMVADAYLPALTAAVRRYEETGRLPVHMILLDQHYYESRRGRIWMDILENPLEARISLPGDNAEREAHLRLRQAELRDAVAASPRFRRDAAASGGERWIRKLVKVHVSILHPSDFSFRSHRLVPGLPFVADNVARDHRKLVLYDANEADPWRGALIAMGVGVGEHYASPTWEDRGYRLRGPAVLEARAAARRLLRNHGFDDEQIPLPLRPLEDAGAVEDAADTRDLVGRALQVHNEVGFGSKQSSVIRAALYELAPAASVIVVPDPLWLSREWAGMLAAAAARGARVHIISPADANAPSPQAPIRALAHDVMKRLLEIRRDAAGAIAAGGGELRIGFYAVTAHVDDVDGRRRELREGLARAPWIRELFPFDAQTLAVLDRAEAWAVTAADSGALDAQDERPRAPQLHQKTQLVARAGAIAALLRIPGWDEVLARQIESQTRETARFADQIGYTQPDIREVATRRTDAMFNAFERALSESDRRLASFYFAVGNQNMDPRGLALDGEATIVTSGFQGIAGLVDTYFLMGRTTWVDDVAELDRFIAPKGGFWRFLARVARPAF
jgi:hypothetical protein